LMGRRVETARPLVDDEGDDRCVRVSGRGPRHGALQGPLARGIAVVNRAWADRIGVEWIRRWFFLPSYQAWFVPYARVGLVVMGLLWMTAGLVIVVLIASGVRVVD
jgi:hypothetical protein